MSEQRRSSGPAQRAYAEPRQDRKVAAVSKSARVPQGYLAGARARRTPWDAVRSAVHGLFFLLELGYVLHGNGAEAATAGI